MKTEEQSNQKLDECCAYFAESPILSRLLEGFREKYVSLGTVGGRVVLCEVSPEDIEVLEGFFGKSFHGKRMVSVSAAGLKKALGQSRFGELIPEEIMKHFFREALKSNKEIRQEQEDARREWFLNVVAQIPVSRAAVWMEKFYEERSALYQLLIRCFKADPKEAGRLLRFVAEALNHLPAEQEKKEYLAVFSARITCDPHYFDEGREAHTLLAAGIREIFGQPEITPGDRVFPAFMKQKQFLCAGILKDDISNYTVACGIHAWKMDGSIHEGIEGYWKIQESMHLSLSTVAGLERAACDEGRIYVFENPSVYAVLAAKTEGKSFLCMNGQPNMAAVLLLDLLAAAGTMIYYAGDFDPEGLWIAQRLKFRYQERLRFLLMDPEHYEKMLSSVALKEKRLKMLERLEEEELVLLAGCIKRNRRAAYQEGLIPDYCEVVYG